MLVSLCTLDRSLCFTLLDCSRTRHVSVQVGDPKAPIFTGIVLCLVGVLAWWHGSPLDCCAPSHCSADRPAAGDTKHCTQGEHHGPLQVNTGLQEAYILVGP